MTTPSSVRFRVTAIATVIVIVVLAATSVALIALQRKVLTESVDETLQRHADDAVAQIAATGLDGEIRPPGDDDAIVQITEGSTVVFSSPANIAANEELAAPVAAGDDAATTARVPGLDGHQRILSTGFVGPGGAQLTVHVSTPLDDVEESIGTLQRSLMAMIPLVAAILAAMIWWLVGRTLRPVEAIRTQVATIGAGDLDRRVPEPASDDEIGRLARTMNAMLDRIETATERQRRFVADASHELRTPLTRMRVALEVDAEHPASANLEQTHADVLADITALQQLIDDLLLLARSDAAPLGADQTVELAGIVEREVERLKAQNSARLTIETDYDEAVLVAASPVHMGRVTRNLLDNAARHTTRTISIKVFSQQGNAVLTVTDDGPGIPPDQRDRVFDRFTRLDESRTGSLGGTGLGLAIARSIVEPYNGSITASDAPDGGAQFTVTLPMSATPEPGAPTQDR